MSSSVQPGTAPVIEPWPVGWPLPLYAMTPLLPWGAAVEFYLAFCETAWGPSVEAAAKAHDGPMRLEPAA